MKIMVVDDSRLVRERVVALVKDIDGVEAIIQAADSATALGAADLVSPDVVILDLRLGGKSGIDLLPLFKQRPRPPVVIVLTNNTGHPSYEKKCRESGADFFFDKSNQFQRMVQVIESLESARRAKGSRGTGGEPGE